MNCLSLTHNRVLCHRSFFVIVFLLVRLSCFEGSALLLYQSAAVCLSLFAAMCGMIAFSIWTSMARDYLDHGWEYGYSYALLTTAWVM